MKTKKSSFFIILLLLSISFLGCVNKNNNEKKRDLTNLKPEKKRQKATIKILAYYQEESGKFLYVDRLILQSLGKNIKGYYGWAAQGDGGYYLIGELTDNKINGTKYSLYDSTSESFTLTIQPKSIKGLSIIGEAVPQVNTDFFNDDNMKSSKFNIYKLPSLKSKILRKHFILANKGFKLVEIGKMEKNNVGNSSYNIWYKVQNDEMKGWVYGLIDVLK